MLSCAQFYFRSLVPYLTRVCNTVMLFSAIPSVANLSVALRLVLGRTSICSGFFDRFKKFKVRVWGMKCNVWRWFGLKVWRTFLNFVLNLIFLGMFERFEIRFCRTKWSFEDQSFKVRGIQNADITFRVRANSNFDT